MTYKAELKYPLLSPVTMRNKNTVTPTKANLRRRRGAKPEGLAVQVARLPNVIEGPPPSDWDRDPLIGLIVRTSGTKVIEPEDPECVCPESP